MIKVPLRFSYISTFFVSNFYENRRTTRITCSTVSLRFFRAEAGSTCFFQRADGAENWEKGVDSGIVTLDGIWGDAAGEGEDGLAVFFSQSGDGDGGFSHSSLSVETTLTGDDDIAVLDERFQRSFFQHDRGARFQDSVHIA